MAPPSPSSEDLSSSYDVVIVGAGQAGITLASRLSEDSSINVLVLEAGEANLDDKLIMTPPMAKELFMKDKYDWHFQTKPQDGYAGRQIMHFRGKGLGGTSAINLNAIVFPSKPSLDGWEALGNPGWNHKAMEPYYQKFHTLHAPSAEMKEKLGLDYLDPSLYGKSGPIQIQFGEEANEFDQAWPRTFKNLGHYAASDPMTGYCKGAYSTPNSRDPKGMTRSYAASGYYNSEVQERSNLRIITEAMVEKVILEGGEAKGIQFKDSKGQQKTVHAAETILSAGVFQSPQILELSGIGNPSILKEHGITASVDLPGVGENLQDHANVGISFESKVPTVDSYRDPNVIKKAMEAYQGSLSGPLAKSMYTGASMPCMALMTDDKYKELGNLLEQHHPNEQSYPSQKKQYELLRDMVSDPNKASIEYLCSPVQVSAGQSGAAAALSDEAKGHDYITIFSSLSHPFSRGTVHITSSEPKTAPAIDPRYFSHPLDVELMSHHLQYIDTIVNTDPLKSLLVPNGLRIPQNIDLTDIKQTREAVKTGFTTYHPCGTCAMMPKDLGGVVDSRLRVHGVKNLRVVDASIFPMVTRGNLQTSVYALAEKAADLIKDDLKKA